MACKPTTCKVCGGSFPACQVKNGVCATCRAKAAKVIAPSPK
jgi:hypothetical protein